MWRRCFIADVVWSINIEFIIIIGVTLSEKQKLLCLWVYELSWKHLERYCVNILCKKLIVTVLFLSTFHLGCTCFLLFVCYCTTICGTPGDVATHNLAAKNLRWVIYCLVNIYFFMFKISHFPPTSGYISLFPSHLPQLLQVVTPGGFIMKKTCLAPMKWTRTL